MRGIFNVFIDHFVILWKYMNFWVDSFLQDLFHTSPIGFLVVLVTPIIFWVNIWLYWFFIRFGKFSFRQCLVLLFFTTLISYPVAIYEHYDDVRNSKSWQMFFNRLIVGRRVIIIGEKDCLDLQDSYDLIYTDSKKLCEYFEKLGKIVDPIREARQESDLILIGPDANYFGSVKIKKQYRL